MSSMWTAHLPTWYSPFRTTQYNVDNPPAYLVLTLQDNPIQCGQPTCLPGTHPSGQPNTMWTAHLPAWYSPFRTTQYNVDSPPAYLVLTLQDNPIQCDESLYWMNKARLEWLIFFAPDSESPAVECSNLLSDVKWDYVCME